VSAARDGDRAGGRAARLAAMKLRAVLPSLLAITLAACARGAGSEPAAARPAADAAPSLPPLADEEPVPPGDPRIELAAKMEGVRPQDLRASPVPGIFELVHEGEVRYISADGGYVFSGDLYKVTEQGDFPNLTEQRRRELRLAMLAAVPADQAIEFGPPDAPHTITVFTDVDCQWCRRLHSEIEDYNRLGIRVRYLSFPRTGPDTESWHKAEAVWCSQDRREALTRAKQGKRVEAGRCDAPILAHYRLGRRVGVTGTPGVVLENGEMIPGYLAPSRMLQAIKESEAAAAQP
jgi:thiol:disulfide interchange protein DsbC